MFMSTQPVKKEVFDNPVYKQKAMQLSLTQRNMLQKQEKSEKEDGAIQTEPRIKVETDLEEKEKPISDDSENEPLVKKVQLQRFSQ